MSPTDDRQFNLRLDADDAERLEALAAGRRVSVQEFLRRLIRQNSDLTEFERTVLVHLFELRKAAATSKLEADGWDQSIEIVAEGYEVFYDQIPRTAGLSTPMSAEDGIFVLDVLSMYRAFDTFARDRPKDAKELEEDAMFTFRGFDGNNEGAFLGFTHFLFYKQDKFTEQLVNKSKTDNFNSHWPMLVEYRAMVEKWKSFDKPHDLTRQQIEKILAVATPKRREGKR